jgi:hypothetical protein
MALVRLNVLQVDDSKITEILKGLYEFQRQNMTIIYNSSKMLIYSSKSRIALSS